MIPYPPAQPTVTIRVRKGFEEVSAGAVTVRVYKNAWHSKKRRKSYRSWMIIAGHGRRRLREKRADHQVALDRAEQLAIDFANGEIAQSQFGLDDRACYHRSQQIITPTGKPLELVAAEYTEAFTSLRAALPPEELPSLSDLVKCFLDHRPAGVAPKDVPEIVTELLASRKDDGIGARWARSLESQLTRFSEWWTGPLHLLRGQEIQTWLRGLGVGPRTRTNYRTAIMSLVSFAQAQGYLAKNWDELKAVRAPEIVDGEIRTLSPDQLAALFAKAGDNLVPFIALTAFAGIRHEEMTGTKKLLDWRDIDFDHDTIYVQKDVAKTGRDRLVPMQPNLVAWLKPHAKRHGPVCVLRNTSNALTRAKTKAGIPHGKNQTRNALRKSFISYRLAVTKNIAQVAEEAGNSPAKIRSNYKRPAREDEAKRWFDIWPTSADIIQLPLAL